MADHQDVLEKKRYDMVLVSNPNLKPTMRCDHQREDSSKLTKVSASSNIYLSNTTSLKSMS